MTTSSKQETEYERGYWVEIEKKRIAGGVSAEAGRIEGGIGGVYGEEQLGLTGYLQYGVPLFQGRIQLDLMEDRQWVPKLVFGIPLKWQQLKFEPHMVWPLAKDKPEPPRLGLKVQYVF